MAVGRPERQLKHNTLVCLQLAAQRLPIDVYRRLVVAVPEPLESLALACGPQVSAFPDPRRPIAAVAAAAAAVARRPQVPAGPPVAPGAQVAAAAGRPLV